MIFSIDLTLSVYVLSIFFREWINLENADLNRKTILGNPGSTCIKAYIRFSSTLAILLVIFRKILREISLFPKNLTLKIKDLELLYYHLIRNFSKAPTNK